MELEASNLESNGVEDDAKRQPDGNFPSNEKSVGSLGGTSSKRDRDSNCIVDCEIHWEDLKLGEEIGRGKLRRHDMCLPLLHMLSFKLFTRMHTCRANLASRDDMMRRITIFEVF